MERRMAFLHKFLLVKSLGLDSLSFSRVKS